MSTWRFRAALAAGLSLALVACEGGQDGGLLDGLAAAGGERPVAMSQARMAGGALLLVPPLGFCIDARSLKDRFALMARCDTLGAPSAAGGAPLGLLTVSVSNGARGLPTADQIGKAANLERISAQTSETDAITFRAEGAPPVKGLDPAHWRGAARLGDQVMGIALYGPPGGRATSAEGRDIINSLIRQSKATP